MTTWGGVTLGGRDLARTLMSRIAMRASSLINSFVFVHCHKQRLVSVYEDRIVYHYENTPVQYTAIFHGCKNEKNLMKNCDIFLIFALNIDRGYTLEPPR